MKLLPALVFSFAATASAAPAFAWNEHAVYTPAAGSQSGVIAIALTEWMTAFYIVFEVQDTTTATHTLYLQRWNGSTFWAAPVVLDSHVGQWVYNPSIIARTGHVTVSAHVRNGVCATIVTGLREYDYDTATGVVDKTRTIDSAAACEEVGHSHIVYSPDDTTYHVCWTRKTGPLATGDEVLCATRTTTAAAWSAAVNLNGAGGAPNDQDHATVAVKSGTNNTRRVAFHDQTANVVTDDNEARLLMDKPGGTTVEYRVPSAAPLPQLGWQDRPFVALSLDNKVHVAWEGGLNGAETIKYERCLHDTPTGCSTAADWEFNNVAVSDPTATYARYPHLRITALRTWLSFEQLIGARREVMVAHRCLSAAYNAAWTLDDPWTGTDDEYTEEYGTPHIAARTVITLDPQTLLVIATVWVGTVSLRENTTTGYYDAMLYEMIEPPC
jgi:hypothetical protein